MFEHYRIVLCTQYSVSERIEVVDLDAEGCMPNKQFWGPRFDKTHLESITDSNRINNRGRCLSEHFLDKEGIYYWSDDMVSDSATRSSTSIQKDRDCHETTKNSGQRTTFLDLVRSSNSTISRTTTLDLVSILEHVQFSMN
jgi:hypothetical protein